MIVQGENKEEKVTPSPLQEWLFTTVHIWHASMTITWMAQKTLNLESEIGNFYLQKEN